MKEKLLFISPVIPDSKGTGCSIRSYNFIQALSRSYDIHLIVGSESLGSFVSCPAKPTGCKVIDQIGLWHPSVLPSVFRYILFRAGISAGWLYRKTSLALRYVTNGRIRELQKIIAGRTFQAVHIFRLRMVPFGLWMKAEYPEIKLCLDLDDIESVTHERIAKLHAKVGSSDLAALYQKEAENYRTLERQWLPCFDKVYVCSENDRQKLHEAYRLDHVQVIPNIVATRPFVSRCSSVANPFVFLFLGGFAYFPNHEGVLFFAHEILPIMRRKMARPFLVLFVGPSLPYSVRQAIAKIPEIRYLGKVPLVEDAYRQSDAVIIPIRAGGGTRIKALEAFSFSVPVIGTRIGLEGIEVLHGQHAMLADSADEFATYCCKVAEDACLREKLITNAYQLVRDKYAPSVVEQCFSIVPEKL
jgi:glycosyltransferase involved in cell wall biosynthesis